MEDGVLVGGSVWLSSGPTPTPRMAKLVNPLNSYWSKLHFVH